MPDPTPAPGRPLPTAAERDKLLEQNRRHSLFTWVAQKGIEPPLVVGADRTHYIEADGRRVLDFASLVLSANAGLHHPRIAAAIAAQAAELSVAAPFMATAIRGRYAAALATVLPHGLDRFLFTLGGADAIEHALKIARLVTGRRKIVSRYRSYHGATSGALAATGDPRRLPFEPLTNSVVRALDPFCYRCPFGSTPDRCQRQCIDHVEQTVEWEGAEQIAAICVESISGTNGGFVPPPEYLPRLRSLCDRYGILLIVDEVLTGFGRTGRWFGFDHFGVVPDMVALGKGITSGHAPLGAVAISSSIAAQFEERPLVTGLTHTAHPISLAAGQAALDVYRDEQLVERAARLGPEIEARLRRLADSAAIVGDLRGAGLYWTLELVKDKSSKQPLAPWNGSAESQRPMKQIAAGLLQAGLHVATRWNYLTIAPPLCIDELELDRGLSLIEAELLGAG